ncbi:bifunctional DNA primase/polymerase [Terriglobus aquaticus]|uniref:Bifunctional DNA primase/polymerase n=1 Tax=Terriglobus aquaticus TaxID=940139 RepID=A0ABW9KHF7_9BACT|nr:bifunctional DNA primase/polymerase [Terriglobus aquaticus]
MNNLEQQAHSHIKRGWFVHPLRPASKIPATNHGKDDATLDPEKVSEWWRRNPNFNVGVSTGPSGLCVLDADHGLASMEEFEAWRVRNRIPETYAVRSGRRPDFGVQMYFRGSVKDGKFELDGVSGDIKSAGGLVLAAGSVHPDTREVYQAIYGDVPVAPMPEAVLELARKSRAAASVQDDGEPITHDRNSRLTSIAGRLRNAGLTAAALEAALLQTNLDRCPDPLDEEEVKRIAANVARYKPADEPVAVTIGGKSSDAHGPQDEPFTGDWSVLFHTREDTENTPDPVFLIRDFLQDESVTGIIGPARARKSIVTLNIIHALLTGERLFGKFEVKNKPERVVYLCPESGKKSLGRRIRNMGLLPYVGESLFFTSMNSDPVALNDPRLLAAMKGAVVFIDTAIRFFKGDENSSEYMKAFGEQCHGLVRHGVKAVVLLHHTAKGAENVTLESGRGSGDFGGFLTCCWGTTLSDYEDAYNAQSLMSCVKQRDFQADSFKLAPSGNQDDFFLQYVEGSANARVQVGAKEKAGKAKALAFARANPDVTAQAMQRALAEQGVAYSESACRGMLRGVRALKITESSSNVLHQQIPTTTHVT